MIKFHIGIDASSNAIGVSLWMDRKLIKKDVVYPQVMNPPVKRVHSILDEFDKTFKISADYIANTGGEVLVVLNRGYVPANGVGDPLKSVEFGLWERLTRMGYSFIDVLDSSWQHNLGITDKVTRAVKKQTTVEYVVEKYLNGHTVMHVSKEKYNYFKHCPPGQMCTTGSMRITDDEADAIAVIDMYLDGKITAKNYTAKKIVNKWTKKAKINQEINKIEKKLSTAGTKLSANSNEKNNLESRPKPHSKRIENMIELREQRIKDILKELEAFENVKQKLLKDKKNL